MKTNVLIVGAGITGLSVAWHLAKAGVKDIVVVDQGYFMNGATGRNGAGIRMQWSTELNCLLAKHSVEFFEKGEALLEYDGSLDFKQNGYLLLSSDEKEHEQFKNNVLLQNKLGIPSQILSKKEALDLVSILNSDSFYGAAYCKKDGHLNPFKVSEAFYLATKKLGVKYRFFEEVHSIKLKDKQVHQVITSKETYEVNYVTNCAGAYARAIGLMANIDIPVYPEKHEILATEPFYPLLGPMIVSFSKNFYIQQVPHGPFIMGSGTNNHQSTHDVSSSWQFTENMAKTIKAVLPDLGKLSIQRQWAGSYDMTPDKQPIISDTEVAGFYVACGFSGRGFMIAPMTGKLISEMILGEKPTIDIKDLSLTRFKNKQQIESEQSFV